MPEPAPHTLVQELTPKPSGQLCREKNIGFFIEDIYCRKGIKVAKVHGIHLDHFPGSRRSRYLASLLVFLPLRTNDVLFRENLIYLGDGKMGSVLFLEEVLNLLSTAIVLPLSYPPKPISLLLDLPVAPFLLGLMMPIQEAHQAKVLNRLNPQMNGFPVFAQPFGDMRFGYALFVKLPADGY